MLLTAALGAATWAVVVVVVEGVVCFFREHREEVGEVIEERCVCSTRHARAGAVCVPPSCVFQRVGASLTGDGANRMMTR